MLLTAAASGVLPALLNASSLNQSCDLTGVIPYWYIVEHLAPRLIICPHAILDPCESSQRLDKWHAQLWRCLHSSIFAFLAHVWRRWNLFDTLGLSKNVKSMYHVRHLVLLAPVHESVPVFALAVHAKVWVRTYLCFSPVEDHSLNVCVAHECLSKNIDTLCKISLHLCGWGWKLSRTWFMWRSKLTGGTKPNF